MSNMYTATLTNGKAEYKDDIIHLVLDFKGS